MIAVRLIRGWVAAHLPGRIERYRFRRDGRLRRPLRRGAVLPLREFGGLSRPGRRIGTQTNPRTRSCAPFDHTDPGARGTDSKMVHTPNHAFQMLMIPSPGAASARFMRMDRIAIARIALTAVQPLRFTRRIESTTGIATETSPYRPATSTACASPFTITNEIAITIPM